MKGNVKRCESELQRASTPDIQKPKNNRNGTMKATAAGFFAHVLTPWTTRSANHSPVERSVVSHDTDPAAAAAAVARRDSVGTEYASGIAR